MADTKITALAAIGANPINVATFPIPMVDLLDNSMAASGTTKKVTVNQILGAGGTATLASATISGDLTVDTSVFKVNTTTDQVGIGTATPTSSTRLDVVGGTFARFNKGAANQYHLRIGNSTKDYGLYVDIDNNGTNGFALYDITAGVDTFRYVPGASGSWTHYINGSTAMTLNSTGLGIGVTPSAWPAASKAIDVDSYGANYAIAAATQVGISRNCYYNGTDWIYKLTTSAQRFEQDNGGGFKWFTAAAGTAGNAITFTQAMTLDASGNLLVKKTASGGTTLGVELLATGQINGATANQDNLNIYNTTAAAYRFYVNAAGTVFATNTTISAISDARFKENVQDIDVGLGAILALKPRKFDWKEGKGKNIKGDRGFIAQEFETVFPNLIDEWKENAPEGEAPYKSVRQDLIPVLVKAIQELTARVQTLETR